LANKGFTPAQIINKLREAEIHITSDTQMAESSRSEDLVHRTGESLGEWVYRVIQCNGKLRDELLNNEIVYTLIEAKVLTEQWRKGYNRVHPHSSLDYRIQPVLVEKSGIGAWTWKKRLMKGS
jgi:transposase InsO family protein